MSCKDKISNTCGKKHNAKCVDYEGPLHANTLIEECDKPSVETVIEDLNTQVDALSSSLDLSTLGDACITYTKAGQNLLAKEAFLALEAKICEIAEFVGLPQAGCPTCESCSPLFEESISCLGLNLGSLVDSCGQQPANLKELLQTMINSINNAG